MSLKLTGARLAMVAIVLFGALFAGWWLIRPLWLTQISGPELRNAIQRYFEVVNTVEGRRDLNVMAQVATGDHLDYLIQVRCRRCPSVQVATRVNVEILQVLDYAADVSKVRFRVEWGWNKVSPDTSIVIGPCHAQAYTDIYILARENGAWKVSGGEETDANPVDDSPELRAHYCSTN